MAKKKQGLIVNFTMNSVPIISRNGDGDWNLFQRADTHFEDDPNDIFHKDDDAKAASLENIAQAANKTIESSVQPLVDNLFKYKDDIANAAESSNK